MMQSPQLSGTPGQRYAAGILPVCWHAGSVLFLVGRDVRDGTWSDFGGKSERFDRGDPITTACREFYEESLGCLYDNKQMRARLTAKTAVLARSSTQNMHRYSMYVTEIPYSPGVSRIVESTVAFLRSKNLHRALVEKLEVRWVTLAELREMPKRMVFSRTIDLHAGLLDSIAAGGSIGWRGICRSRAGAWNDIDDSMNSMTQSYPSYPSSQLTQSSRLASPSDLNV